MDKTFAKLGWKVPETPPFLPAGWKGSLDKMPYPGLHHAAQSEGAAAIPGKG